EGLPRSPTGAGTTFAPREAKTCAARSMGRAEGDKSSRGVNRVTGRSRALFRRYPDIGDLAVWREDERLDPRRTTRCHPVAIRLSLSVARLLDEPEGARPSERLIERSGLLDL